MLGQPVTVRTIVPLQGVGLRGKGCNLLRESRFEHKCERAVELVRRQFSIACLLKRVDIRSVWQHRIVQRNATRHEATPGLRVIDALNQPHKLTHDVHVVPWRTERVLRNDPSVGEDYEVDICGAGCL